MSDALTDEIDRDWLCLAFPMLALDGLDRRQSHTATVARVVIDGPEQRAEVYLADARAQALGIRRGQRLAAAQALAPELQILRRTRTVAALCRWPSARCWNTWQPGLMATPAASAWTARNCCSNSKAACACSVVMRPWNSNCAAI